MRNAILALAAALLMGCFKPDEQKVAGVDDFPNSIHAQVSGFLEESKKSGDIALVPSVTDSILQVQGFNVAAAKLAAGKLGAGAQGSQGSQGMNGLAKVSALSAADTGCSGTLKFDTTINAPTKTTVNSVTICFDGKALDSIKGNETVLHGRSVTTYKNGRVETADIEDADGDGIVNPVAGKKSKARMTLTALEAGVLEKTVLVVGPGPDNNFDTEPDNVIYEAAWTKTANSGKDTLGAAAYTDADGDGIVIDNSKASLFDLDLFQKGPTADHPDAVTSRARMRLNAHYGVASQEPRRVHFEVTTTDGRTQSADLLSKNGEEDIGITDTLKAHFMITGAAEKDTVDTMETFLTMKVGADLDDKSDDNVYAIDVRVKKKLGEEVSDRFTFISDRPIPSGKEPQSGTLSMKVEYKDASSLEVDGKLSDKGMDVIIKNRDGKRLHVVWDPLGRGVSLEEIP